MSRIARLEVPRPDGTIRIFTPVPPPVPPLEVVNGPDLYMGPDMKSRNGQNHPGTRSPIRLKMFPMDSFWGPYTWQINRLLHPTKSETWLEHQMSGMFNGAKAWDNGNGLYSGHWKIANLTCGGATHRLLNESVRTFDSRHWRPVRGLDWNKRPKMPTSLADIDMHYHFIPTTARDSGNGPFPQFDDGEDYPPGRCLIPYFAAEYDDNGTAFNWVDIDGYPERPGKAWRVAEVGHPFIPARWDLTKGLIDP